MCAEGCQTSDAPAATSLPLVLMVGVPETTMSPQLAMVSPHSSSVSGVGEGQGALLRLAPVTHNRVCKCELWTRLQWFMVPSQVNYCPQLQSCLPGGAHRELFNTSGTVSNPV